MNTYMICIQLPSELTEEFMSLIPNQRKRINELMDEGKVVQYSLAMDRSLAWVTIMANSEQKALDVLATFPLIRFMKPEIFELAFHNSISNELPLLIMN
jgi:muconolactone delta-isomerase